MEEHRTDSNSQHDTLTYIRLVQPSSDGFINLVIGAILQNAVFLPYNFIFAYIKFNRCDRWPQ